MEASASTAAAPAAATRAASIRLSGEANVWLPEAPAARPTCPRSASSRPPSKGPPAPRAP
eukprot:scaffold20396_cov101-Isochrysis_galbana.AAC.2